MALFLLPAQIVAKPSVVASIMPVHSLVAGVMDGVSTPDLLLPKASSPHDFALRPSDAKKLNEADVVFWIGPALEGFMEKTLLVNPTNPGKSVTLIDLATVRLLPREGGVWEKHDHDGEHEHERMVIDPHIWLDPVNAQAMVTAIENALIKVDAVHAMQYQNNAATLRKKLQALDEELATLLANDKKTPFIVFHDAFQYFEKRYGLNGAGAITVNPEQKPSAKRLNELRARVQKSGVRCIFAEPQFNDGLINSIVEGSQAKRGTLDPLGADETTGQDAYFLMMRHLAQTAHLCLDEKP